MADVFLEHGRPVTDTNAVSTFLAVVAAHCTGSIGCDSAGHGSRAMVGLKRDLAATAGEDAIVSALYLAGDHASLHFAPQVEDDDGLFCRGLGAFEPAIAKLEWAGGHHDAMSAFLAFAGEGKIPGLEGPRDIEAHDKIRNAAHDTGLIHARADQSNGF
jgi:hypothetical protein